MGAFALGCASDNSAAVGRDAGRTLGGRTEALTPDAGVSAIPSSDSSAAEPSPGHADASTGGGSNAPTVYDAGVDSSPPETAEVSSSSDATTTSLDSGWFATNDAAWTDSASGTSATSVSSVDLGTSDTNHTLDTATNGTTHESSTNSNGTTTEQSEPPDASIEPVCGDGVVDEDEACDDGNALGGDGCSLLCAVEPGFSCASEPSVCGDVDECSLGSNPCEPHAACTNRDGGFDCACESGYEADGDGCVDVDECASASEPCHAEATCSNTEGAFVCTCKPGFSGDGVTCTNVDECDADESPCGPNAVCVDTVGSYTCTCEDGFDGDGGTCSDVDECADDAHNCDVNATCTDADGSFICTCNDGFVGDGETCEPLPDPDGVLVLAPSTIELVSSAEVIVTQQLTLTNDSTIAVDFSFVTNDSWLSVSPTTGTVAPDEAISVEVTAERGSLALGVYSGSVELTHDAASPSSPVSVPVTFEVNYRPTSPYLLNPELAIGYVEEIAAFRYKARDNVNGGVHTHVDREGNPLGLDEKSMCGQSRAGYAFTRAFMLTGDESYLEHAHYALKFLYDHGYDNGWYFVTTNAGNYVPHWGHDEWWSFQQHYALLGITAMVEATGGNTDWGDGSQTDAFWLNTGVNSNYTRLWDNNSATAGYFDHASTDWSTRRGKGFTPTVDAVTTHAELLALMTDNAVHDARLYELADNILEHMVGNMSISAAGFPEIFDGDWNVDNSQPNAEIGHLYKTSWVLARIYLMDRSRTRYTEAARDIMWDLWNSGAYDRVNGGPYSTINWQTGAIVSNNKNQWMLEQGLTAGLTNYHSTTERVDRNMFLEVADGSLNFYMNHLVDDVYGETYSDVSVDGSTIVNAEKGGLFSAGYHSSELGYYVYLYGNLYYHRRPVTLYYKYPPSPTAQSIQLNPIPLDDNVVTITAVELDGSPYTSYTSATRTLNLPAGTGGVFKVTFGVTD